MTGREVPGTIGVFVEARSNHREWKLGIERSPDPSVCLFFELQPVASVKRDEVKLTLMSGYVAAARVQRIKSTSIYVRIYGKRIRK